MGKVFIEQESGGTNESGESEERGGAVWLVLIQLFNGD